MPKINTIKIPKKVRYTEDIDAEFYLRKAGAHEDKRKKRQAQKMKRQMQEWDE